jgi:hypothetical protein
VVVWRRCGDGVEMGRVGGGYGAEREYVVDGWDFEIGGIFCSYSNNRTQDRDRSEGEIRDTLPNFGHLFQKQKHFINKATTYPNRSFYNPPKENKT